MPIKQNQIEAQLKSGELIIQDGKIILNLNWIEEQYWAQEQERLRLKYQAIREGWKQKEKEKQAATKWQAEQVRIEKCLAELWLNK
jgi:hypothetical protein